MMDIYEKLAKARAEQDALQCEIDERRAERRKVETENAQDLAKFVVGVVVVMAVVHSVGMCLLIFGGK